MGFHNWEQGAFVIPQSEWAAVKKTLQEAHNQNRERVFGLANQMYNALHQDYKGQRNVRYFRGTRGGRLGALDEKLMDWSEGNPREASRIGIAGMDMVEKLLTPKISDLRAADPRFREEGTEQEIERLAHQKPNKPKRKDLDRFLAAATRSTTEYHAEPAHLRLDNESRTLHWVVEENNHACEEARNTWLGAALFNHLKQIHWTKNSGGVFWGGDEIREDEANGPGEGGAYQKFTFGNPEAIRKDEEPSFEPPTP